MASDDGLVGPERVEQSDHVADHVEHSVLVDRFGTIGLPIAAHVRGHRPEPGLGDCTQLMAPGIPKPGKPVAKQDERSGACFRWVHVDALRLEGAMRHFCHRA